MTPWNIFGTYSVPWDRAAARGDQFSWAGRSSWSRFRVGRDRSRVLSHSRRRPGCLDNASKPGRRNTSEAGS